MNSCRKVRRPVSYGYRVGEVDLEMPDRGKEDSSIILDNDQTLRKVTAVSLGPHVIGAARPRVDRDDPATKAAGAIKRIMKQIPRRQRNMLAKFDRFNRKWLKKNLVPLSPHTDTSFETWIEQCPYTERDKTRMKKVYADNIETFDDMTVRIVKGFPKDEAYDVYKHLRWIMSRSDEFKCMYGPWIKCIEKEVYKHPAFIKYVPTNERGQYITEMLGTVGPFYETDYTAYESQFDKIAMRIMEFNLYEHMTRLVPGHDEFMRMNFGVLGKNNHIVSKNMKFNVEARMSGEMSTSLGNGYSNLMTMLFVAHYKKCTNVEGVVEGDDGLFTMVGTPPSAQDFADVGFHIKLQQHSVINECSFCGLVFDEIDQRVVTDPRKVLLSTAWTSRRYLPASDRTLHTLLRCKSLSLLAQYPGAPIIQSVALYGLRMTQHISKRDVNRMIAKMDASSWEREKMFRDLTCKPQPCGVGQRTRQLVADRYHVTQEQQRFIESYYDKKCDLLPVKLPYPDLWNDDQVDYYSHYFVNYPHVEGSLTLGFDDPRVLEHLKTLCSITEV